MAPWIPGLRTSLLAGETESDKAKEKIAALFRKLIDVTLSDPHAQLYAGAVGVARHPPGRGAPRHLP